MISGFHILSQNKNNFYYFRLELLIFLVYLQVVKHHLDGGLGITTVWDFMKEYNNKERGDIGQLDIVTGFFTISTLSRLYEELPEENHYRIISSEMVCEDLKKDFIVDLLSDDMDISSMGNLDKHAAQAIAFLERKTVEMRAVVPEFCHAKAYLFKNKDPHRLSYYLTGSSNLTPAGIGFKPSSNVELNIAETGGSSNNTTMSSASGTMAFGLKPRKKCPRIGRTRNQR